MHNELSTQMEEIYMQQDNSPVLVNRQSFDCNVQIIKQPQIQLTNSLIESNLNCPRNN